MRKGASAEGLGVQKQVLGELEGLLGHLVGLRDQHGCPNDSWHPCWALLGLLLVVHGGPGLHIWPLGHYGGLMWCHWLQNWTGTCQKMMFNDSLELRIDDALVTVAFSPH